MNRRHNILILASILCVILAVTAMFVLQRRNRSVIYRIESTIIEQNEMLRKQAERQRLLYATLFLDPKLAETGRNTIFLRLHDDMCFNCYAPTIRELYKLEEQFDISLQAAGAYHYDATFRQTLRDLEWRDRAAGNGMPPREALPADEAMIPYLFTLGPDGQIDALLFLSKQIPGETVSAFFGAAVRRFAE